MATKQGKRRRHNLWLKDPHCHWCKCLTVLPTGHMGHQPDNLATIDHLLTRLTGRRSLVNADTPYGSTTVLACRKCNTRRNNEEQRAMPIDVLRIRAGQAARYGLTPDVSVPQLVAVREKPAPPALSDLTISVLDPILLLT